MQSEKDRMKHSFRVSELIIKYQKGTLSESEKEELSVWVDASDKTQFLREMTTGKILEKDLEEYARANTEKGYSRVINKLEKKARLGIAQYNLIFKVAAVVLVLLSGLVYLLSRHKPSTNQQLIALSDSNLIVPGSKKARLIYVDGEILLEQGKDTTFTNDTLTVINSADGIVSYRNDLKTKVSTTQWNILEAPAGGGYTIVLEDGTKVFLNAASSISYPVHFLAGERNVFLRGEGYFEVAKDAKRPFIVTANNISIKAVGTAFNVDCKRYANTKSVLTTVTEGAVLIGRSHSTTLVKAGEVALSDNLLTKFVAPKKDITELIAWKEGMFSFKSENIEVVMQQLSEWYNVKIEYDSTFNRHKYFTGEIKRSVPLSTLLEMIELTGIAKFSLSQRTLKVLPNTK
ncbi:FecR family protein [Filimonas effusa]|uniref:FecR family protein n=1 Tax=Filimonas effusa TaxID=2508721 RepID=A0A4Q1DE86_9BACT|nr:FecR family protein [Filimonas effusa]RXK87003.1 FecR family protein [Filimonas effusa]